VLTFSVSRGRGKADPTRYLTFEAGSLPSQRKVRSDIKAAVFLLIALMTATVLPWSSIWEPSGTGNFPVAEVATKIRYGAFVKLEPRISLFFPSSNTLVGR
jgi:hypothetical protein